MVWQVLSPNETDLLTWQDTWPRATVLQGNFSSDALLLCRSRSVSAFEPELSFIATRC